jgi:heavy metal translocating P-type ATPase
MPQTLALQTPCQHCQLLFQSSPGQLFCCGGCEIVYGFIQGQGLGQFYDLRDANPPSRPAPVSPTQETSTYDYCDNQDFLKRSNSSGVRMRFYLEGMNCTACLWLLEKLPSLCSDAASAEVDMSTSTIEVERKPDGSFAKIAQALHRLGYRPRPIVETNEAAHFQAIEKRRDLIRIGVAGAATGNIMIFAVSIYAGSSGQWAADFRWLSAVLALPVLTFCAWPFYRSAVSALRTKHLNLDVPIVTALLTGTVVSCWSLFHAGQAIYFDSLSMLVFLLLSSRLLLKRVQTQYLGARLLENEFLLTTVEKILPSGATTQISSIELKIGDTIRVVACKTVPVDGRVISGHGFINSAVLTGESAPVKICEGMKIEAGVESLSDSWYMQVEQLGPQTRIAKIFRDTERAATQKSRFVHSSERAARWFISVVFVFAVGVVAFFWQTDLAEGVSRALALIIVTCPCVFGIAIPLSMSLAVRQAAAHGIIIKDSGTIERLWQTDTLVFDKTGTLTTGEMSVLNFSSTNPSELEIVLGLEQDQKHPVARALTAALQKMGVSPRHLNNILELESGGVTGNMGGFQYSVEPLKIARHGSQDELIPSSVGLFRGDSLLASFELGERIRKEAPPTLAWARTHFSTVRLISGDQAPVVQRCARLLGFRDGAFESGKTPEDKALAVRKLGSRVAMIGDGANDAAALATAAVGIAVCGSLDVSLRAADVYLTRQSLETIPTLFSIAALTRSAIYRNLLFSTSFNLLSGSLALMGLMTPLWAAVFMPLSSMTVLLSATWTGNRISKLEDQL